MLAACQQVQVPVPPVDPTGEEYRPGASGPVEVLDIGGISFMYEVIDGLAIFEGDMILGTAEELEELKDADDIELTPEGLPVVGNISTQGAALYRRVCWTFLFIPVHCENYRWPGATVPYVIKSNDWGDDTAMMTQRIMDAIAIIHEAHRGALRATYQRGRLRRVQG